MTEIAISCEDIVLLPSGLVCETLVIEMLLSVYSSVHRVQESFLDTVYI